MGRRKQNYAFRARDKSKALSKITQSLKVRTGIKWVFDEQVWWAKFGGFDWNVLVRKKLKKKKTAENNNANSESIEKSYEFLLAKTQYLSSIPQRMFLKILWHLCKIPDLQKASSAT